MAKSVYSDFDMLGISRILNLLDAAADGEPATFRQLKAAIQGLNWKDDVAAASTANINLSAPGTTIDGVTMSNGWRFLAKNQTTTTANGIYIYNGSGSAATRALDLDVSDEFNAATVTVQAGTTNAGTTWRCSNVNPTVGSTAITFVAFGSAAPAASETQSGVAEIATQAETDTGTDDTRFLTALKAKTASWMLKRYSIAIGDGSATSFPITHHLNSRDVIVSVFRNSASYDEIMVDVGHPTVNTVVVGPFNAAPGINAFDVVVHY